MSRHKRPDWMVPALLILLSAAPVSIGLYRVATLVQGGPIEHETERFFAFPVSIAVHALSSTLFSVLGALQFSRVLRRRSWHAMAGRLVWASGCVSAASGLWLTLVLPPGQYVGSWLFAVRLIVACGMLFCLFKGLQAVLRRDFGKHGAWMIRSYALGIGAGTQVFTHLPIILYPDVGSELTRTLCMSAGWGINLAVAEWVIRSGTRRKRGEKIGALA